MGDQVNEAAVKHQFRDATKMIPQFRDVTKKEQPNKVEMDKNNLRRLNMAKAREVLEEVVGFYKAWASSGKEANDYLMGACHVAMEALSAPARNCDMYPDFNSAIRAFAKKQPNTKKKWDMERYCIFTNWLFAKAKGEAK